MEEYLRPNRHNWIADSISYNFWQTQVVRLKIKFHKPLRINRNKQIHAYFHCESLDCVNRVYNKQYTYPEL
ncbi:MAG: hypothetical protein RR550_01945, partial [Rikenellaceae bacterium]